MKKRLYILIYLLMSISTFSQIKSLENGGHDIYLKIQQNNLKTKTAVIEIQNRIHEGEKLLNQGYYYTAIDILKKNIDLSTDITESNPFEIAQTHLNIARAYIGVVHIEKFKLHLDLYYKYIRIASPDKEIYKALYFSYLSKYYNMRMLFAKAIKYSTFGMKIYHENKGEMENIPAYIFYDNHLFSLRNSNVSFEYKTKYKDSIQSLIESEYPQFDTQKSIALISSELFVLDSLSNAFHMNSKLNKNELKVAEELKSIFLKESINIQKHIGKYNPFSARIELLVGLLHYYNLNYQKAILQNKKSANLITANEVLGNEVFTPNNLLLAASYTQNSIINNTLYEINGDINFLLENVQIFNNGKKVWQYFIEDRINSFQDFNTNNYIKNPFAAIQKNYLQLYQRTQNKDYRQEIFASGELAKHYSLQYLMKRKKNPEIEDEKIKDYIRFESILRGLNTEMADPEYWRNEFKKIKKYSSIIESLHIENIQKKLSYNQAIISFSDYTKERKTYILAQIITSNLDTVIYLPTKFSEIKDDFENQMNLAFMSFDIHSFQEKSQQYYNDLAKPITNILPSHIQELLIIKSPIIEELNLNFNVLVTEITTTSSFKNLSYLRNKYVISYPISVSTYFATTNDLKNKKQKISVLVADNKSMSPLKYVSDFVKNLSKSFEINALVGADCNKETFISSLKNSDVIIVVSHGRGSNSDEIENNGIYLSDGFFSSNEISKLQSNCKLLVLAGCKTGVGFNSNEGMINLARAFTYSGVQSLILSTDDIDEISTLKILESMLHNLANGQSKSNALHLAQNEYLTKSSSRKTNPLYWANLILVDNKEPINITKKTNTTKIAANAIALSALGFFLLWILIKLLQ